MKLISPLEFASTAADEISLFHKLSDGNGTNPPRLPPCPGDMTLHALGGGGGGGGGRGLLEVRCTFIADEVLEPGFGLRTVTAIVPADAAVPDAVSFVDETKLVFNAAPPKRTCAPLTKSDPFTVRVKPPVGKLVGL